ncbi:MAG TPA: acyl-CoA dehydrogenase family protein [Candidatus Binataceae bacterium]|nr:acyl-CoA dehydrogenase family protein [Candidatus Binataceae bacterium]
MADSIATASEAQAQSSEGAKDHLLEELVQRARSMYPRLRERAGAAERMRRLPAETMTEFAQADFFKTLQPSRYGGYELDYGTSQVRIGTELARACGSSSWVFSITACHSWIAGMFPLAAQEDVWSAGPETLLGSSFAPEQVRVEPAGGGVKLWGQWKFSSGVDFAQWVILGGLPIACPGGQPELHWCLVPLGDFRVLDTWHAAGLRATGSNDVVVEGAWVPAHRLVPARAFYEGSGPGTAANRCHIFRLPLSGCFGYNLAAPAPGIAQGALEAFCERAKNQPQRVGRPRIADNELNQLQVAEAAVMIECASWLLLRDARDLNDTARRGQPINPAMRALNRRDLAYAGQLCLRAVDLINSMSGAHGIDEDNPVQRSFRDLHALTAHIGMQWRNAAGDGQYRMGQTIREGW